MFRFDSFCCRARLLTAAAGLATLTSISATAEVIEFAGYQVEVDATAGTGENASVLVVDWDTFSGPYASPSHAFLYRWDGSATLQDMLNAFQSDGVFTVATADFGGTLFLNNINYTDADGDTHANPVDGNWELASGTNPLGDWQGFDLSNPDWDFSLVGINQELLANGQFEGINAAFFDADNGFARVGSPLTVPLVPEPGSAALVIGIGGLALRRRWRR